MKSTIFAKWFFFLSAAMAVLAWGQMRRWPPAEDILADILREPVQTETQASPFAIRHKGKVYSITPRFNYELWGLVVSKHESANLFDYYHQQWGDELNPGDLCVIWGKNVESGIFRKMKFLSGSWTCYWKFGYTQRPEVTAPFHGDQLSNNHLLVESPLLADELRRVRRGDQIYMKGYLAEYSHSEGAFHRGTSVCRTDEGSGACETVFLKELKILRQAHPFWRCFYVLVRIALAVSLIFLFMSFIKTCQRRPGGGMPVE